MVNIKLEPFEKKNSRPNPCFTNSNLVIHKAIHFQTTNSFYRSSINKVPQAGL